MANFTAAPTEQTLTQLLMIDLEDWAPWQYVGHFVLVAVSLLSFEYAMWGGSMDVFQKGKPFRFGNIPNGGPVLTDDMPHCKDFLWTGVNSIILSPFYLLHFMRYVQTADGIDWEPLPPLSVPLQFLAVFLVYDSIYVPLHGMAHWPILYPWVHKHHHRQSSPFRGMWDGINVNPIEYVAGTYLHIGALWLVEKCVVSLGGHVHWSVPAIFFFVSAACASLNHSRHDVRVLAPFFFDVRHRSVHHVCPRTNYGQFTMWWDRLWGSHPGYEEFQARKARGSHRRSLEGSSSA